MNNNVIVVGCGRVGSQLANMLSENDNNVCVVDKNPEAFSNLGFSFNGSVIDGVGFDEAVLRRAGVETCDCVAAVTESDNTNFMIAEVASRLFEVPHVIARLNTLGHERAYELLGFDYICGTNLTAEAIFSKITSGHGFHVCSFGNFEILRFSLNLKGNGLESITVSQLEKAHSIRIVAFERADGSSSSIPSSDSVLEHGDTVLACVRHSLIDLFSRWIQS